MAGIASLAATGSADAVIGGAFVFGSGFGVLQNATLALMYARVPAGGESAVSAIWNAAYDLGMAGRRALRRAGGRGHRLPGDLRADRRRDGPRARCRPP